MIKWLSALFVRFIDRFFVVIAAILFAQAPLFMQHYTQQLVARESELRVQVEALREAANRSNKTLEQLTQKFIENSDRDVVRQGEVMLATVNRWQRLSDALRAMQASSIGKRPFLFLYHFKSDIFTSTLQHFKIGLPLNLEGAVYAFFGVGFGYLAFTLLRTMARKLSHFFSARLRRFYSKGRALAVSKTRLSKPE